MKKWLITLLFLMKGVCSFAQCNFTFTTIETNSVCFNSGKIQVNSVLDASVISYQVSITGNNGYSALGNSPSEIFSNLAADEYLIKMDIICPGGVTKTKTKTVNITSTYKLPSLYLISKTNSTLCKHIGYVQLDIQQGNAPYTITVDAAPAAYVGSTSFPNLSLGTQLINDLPPGNYVFKLVDACGGTTAVNVNIVDYDYVGNLYCSAVEYTSADCTGYAFWFSNYYTSSFFEYLVEVDGINISGSWQDIINSNIIYVNLPYTYGQMRALNKEVVIKARMKNAAPCEKQFTHRIPLAKLDIKGQKVNCTDINLIFKPYNVCYPYNWVLKNSLNVVVAQENGVSSTSNQTVLVKYNENYTLTCTATSGEILSEIFSFTYPINDYYSMVRECSNQFYLYNFTSGTYSIKYLNPSSDKTNPININATFTGPGDHYPFPSGQVVLDGDYMFEITDACGNVDLVTVNFYKYNYQNDISFDTSKTCNGFKFSPKGTFEQNGSTSYGYFYPISQPTNSPPLPSSISSNGGYAFLQESGTYKFVFGRSRYCIVDTLEFVYNKKELSYEYSYGYDCGMGNGRINIRAKDGVEPYVYKLTDGITTITNNTGYFEKGSIGDNFTVTITDACNLKSFSIDIDVTDFNNVNYILAPDAVCLGEPIDIKSILFNSTNTSWELPNGSTIVGPQITIPIATKVDSGTYTITTTPDGCTPVTKSVDVRVEHPDKLNLVDSFFVCLNQPLIISPTPSADHYIEWFDNSHTLLNPFNPSTATAGDYTYYVRQVNSILGCEGDYEKVVVRVHNLPVLAPITFESCKGINPILEITGNPGSNYHLYYDIAASQLITSDTCINTNFSLNLPFALTYDTIVYLQETNKNGCKSNIVAVNINIYPSDFSFNYTAPLICSGESPVINLTNLVITNTYTIFADVAKTDTLYKFDASSTTEVVNITRTLTDTTIFYMEVSDIMTCVSDTLATLIVNVAPLPVLSPITFESCEGINPVLNITGNSGSSYSLYYDVAATQPIMSDNCTVVNCPLSFNLPFALTYDTTIYLQETSQYGCKSNIVAVNINIYPSDFSFNYTAPLICSGESPVINLTNLVITNTYTIFADVAKTDTLYKFDASSPTEVVNITRTLTDTIIFYVEVSNTMTCISDTLATIIVNVAPLPILNPITFESCEGVIPVLNITGNSGSNYSLYYDVAKTQPIMSDNCMAASCPLSFNIPFALTYDTTIYLQETSQYGCKSNIVAVNINIYPSDFSFNYTAPIICGQGIPAINLTDLVITNTYTIFADVAKTDTLYKFDASSTTEVVNITRTLTDTTILYMEVSDTMTCISDTLAKIIVNVAPLPVLSPITFESCEGINPVLNITGNSGSSYSLYYDVAATQPIMSDNCPAVNCPLSFNLPFALTHDTTIYLQETNQYGCKSNIVAVNINIYPSDFSFNYTAPIICGQGIPAINLTDLVLTNTYTLFSDNTKTDTLYAFTANSTSENVSINRVLSNTTTFYVEVSDTMGCIIKNLEEIDNTVRALPVVNINTNAGLICLNKDIDITFSNLVAGSEYLVKPLNTNVSVLNFTSANGIKKTKLNIESDTSVFYVIEKDMYGCVSDTTFNFNLFANKETIRNIKIIADSICENESPEIELTNLTENSKYSIYYNSDLQSKIFTFKANSNEKQILLDGLDESKTVYVTMDDNNCNTSDYKTDYIQVYKNPKISTTDVPDFSTERPYTLQLEVQSVDNYGISLIGGQLPNGLTLGTDGIISGTPNERADNLVSEFIVEATTINGCKDKKEYTLRGDLLIPKVFTPNGDGVNDFFMAGYEIVIFDKLGIKVFDGDNGWDGTYKGKLVNDDIYFYKLSYKKDGRTINRTGYIGVLSKE